MIKKLKLVITDACPVVVAVVVPPAAVVVVPPAADVVVVVVTAVIGVVEFSRSKILRSPYSTNN